MTATTKKDGDHTHIAKRLFRLSRYFETLDHRLLLQLTCLPWLERLSFFDTQDQLLWQYSMHHYSPSQHQQQKPQG